VITMTSRDLFITIRYKTDKLQFSIRAKPLKSILTILGWNKRVECVSSNWIHIILYTMLYIPMLFRDRFVISPYFFFGERGDCISFFLMLNNHVTITSIVNNHTNNLKNKFL